MVPYDNACIVWIREKIISYAPMIQVKADLFRKWLLDPAFKEATGTPSPLLLTLRMPQADISDQ